MDMRHAPARTLQRRSAATRCGFAPVDIAQLRQGWRRQIRRDVLRSWLEHVVALVVAHGLRNVCIQEACGVARILDQLWDLVGLRIGVVQELRPRL